MKRMNKKGASLTGFSEVAIFFVLLMAVLFIVITGMNATYHKTPTDTSFNPTFGIDTGALYNASVNYQAKLEQQAQSGEATTNTINGVSLTTIWAMVLAGMNYTWSFITGGWIEGAIKLMNLGQAGDQLALILRILYGLAVGFIAIKLILKVRA